MPASLHETSRTVDIGDWTLSFCSIAAMVQEDSWLADTVKAIGVIGANAPAPGQRIGREDALARKQLMLWQHQVRDFQQSALNTSEIEEFPALDWQMQR